MVDVCSGRGYWKLGVLVSVISRRRSCEPCPTSHRRHLCDATTRGAKRLVICSRISGSHWHSERLFTDELFNPSSKRKLRMAHWRRQVQSEVARFSGLEVEMLDHRLEEAWLWLA